MSFDKLDPVLYWLMAVKLILVSSVVVNVELDSTGFVEVIVELEISSFGVVLVELELSSFGKVIVELELSSFVVAFAIEAAWHETTIIR